MNTLDESLKKMDPHIGEDRHKVLPVLLRELREKKKGKRSGSEVARAVGVWQSYVAKVEAGTTKATDAYINGLCDFLALSDNWRTLLHSLNGEITNDDRRKLIDCCLGLSPTRIYLAHRSTIPISQLHTYLNKNPMVVITRSYIDFQLLYWKIKDPSTVPFFKSNPNPLVYDTGSPKADVSYLISSVASDYQLIDDVLLVSDFLGFLQFDAGERVQFFIEQFEMMRQHLEPYFDAKRL